MFEVRESGNKQFWLSHAVILLSTVLGVYLAAQAGYRTALDFEVTRAQRDSYFMRVALLDELNDNIEFAEKFAAVFAPATGRRRTSEVHLLAFLHRLELEPAMGERAEEILFDVEVDGIRYLLIRMPKIEKTHLSPREQEIVRMVAEGHPNKVIADVLNISSWTVCTHLRRIFAKLGVGSRAAMVARLLDGRIPGQPI